MSKWFLGCILLSQVLFIACNEDSVANLTVSLVPVHNGQAIDAGQVIEDVTGRNFSISDLRMYITDLYLIKDNGEKVLLEDLALIEWPGSGSDINMNIPKDDYQGFEFNIGLDPLTNSSDPASFLPDHPLSEDQDMHLGANRYIFVSFNGLVDTSAAMNSIPQNSIVYRLGRDVLYSPVKVVQNLDITGTIIFFSLDFEVSRLFSGMAGDINLQTNLINNSESGDMPNALIVVNNFVEALEED